MNNSSSMFASALALSALFTLSGVMAGCIGSEEPDEATASAEEAIINESGAMSIPAQSEIRLASAGDGSPLALTLDAGWRQLAPGVWESEAGEGAGRIVVGAEGHTWAIERAEKDLSGLYELGAAQADAARVTTAAVEVVPADNSATASSGGAVRVEFTLK